MSEVVSQTTQSGGGQERSGGGQERRRRSNKIWRKKKRTMETTTIKFKGATPDLKGHYIVTHQEAPGKAEVTCRKTMEAIERHSYRTCQHPQDLADFFEKGVRPTLEEPPEPDGTMTRTTEAIWSANTKTHVKRNSILE